MQILVAFVLAVENVTPLGRCLIRHIFCWRKITLQNLTSFRY